MPRAAAIEPMTLGNMRANGVRSLILAAIVLAGVVFAPSDATRAQSTAERQAACELSAIRDTRSALAVQLIRSTCNWLALNADSLLNEQKQELLHLPFAEPVRSTNGCGGAGHRLSMPDGQSTLTQCPRRRDHLRRPVRGTLGAVDFRVAWPVPQSTSDRLMGKQGA
jgi:hypothetical protein